MLAVAKTHRKMAIGTTLVKKAVQAMKDLNADEV
jgi:predicted N-acetyltransferase YhbS